jgi:6-phosphogluconolactonase
MDGMTEGIKMQEWTRRDFFKGAAAVAILPAMAGAETAGGGKLRAFAGTYTSAVDGGANGEGIYSFEFDPRTGALTAGRLVAKTPNPSWIVIHPSKKYLYAINEVTNYTGASGSVTAYAMDEASGALTWINTMSSEGAGPAHMSLDKTGKFAFVANYAGGTIAVLPIGGNGSLGAAVDVHRDTDNLGQKLAKDAPRGSFAISGHDKPHAHMILPDPTNKFVLATDLAQDRIYVYTFDSATGKLTAASTPFASLPSGNGPRHFAFHPNGHWFYLVEEEASVVAFFHFDPATGALEQQQALSILPAGFAGTSFASEIVVSPDGKFLYSANRLHDTIAVCAIGAEGKLKLIGETSTLGDYPRHCGIDPTGNFLLVCDQKSDAIVTFKRNKVTGALSVASYAAVGTPGILVFV